MVIWILIATFPRNENLVKILNGEKDKNLLRTMASLICLCTLPKDSHKHTICILSILNTMHIFFYILSFSEKKKEIK